MIVFAPVLEIYITNVCNLACKECNRFNNYNFKGHLKWDDYAGEMEQWSKKIDAKTITLIGGEPTLHPDLETWVMNIRQLWPNTELSIQTNGTYTRPHFITFWAKYQAGFKISLHDISTASTIMENWTTNFGIDQFLPGFVFSQASILKKDKHFVVHNNDKQSAFNHCGMKYDHTLFRGKLYKCPPMALLPELNTQFNIGMSEDESTLLSKYIPLSANCTEEQLDEFVKTRETLIDQCQFCPASTTLNMAYGNLDANKIPYFDTINKDNIGKFLKIS
jgi:organic radical activating enzyme